MFLFELPNAITDFQKFQIFGCNAAEDDLLKDDCVVCYKIQEDKS